MSHCLVKMMDGSEELTALRRGAEVEDWNSCQRAVEMLLRRLSPIAAVRLAARQLWSSLVSFERHHPSAKWAREHLARIEDGEEHLRVPPEALAEYPGPGGNNFVAGVEALTEAYGADCDPDRRVHKAAHAVSQAVMVSALDVGGTERPEIWRRWYERALSGARPSLDSHPLLEISNLERVAEHRRSRWFAIADELEALLGRE